MQETLEKDGKLQKKNMDKYKLKITLEVLNNVSIRYRKTAQYIEENMKKVCKKDKIPVE